MTDDEKRKAADLNFGEQGVMLERNAKLYAPGNSELVEFLWFSVVTDVHNRACGGCAEPGVPKETEDEIIIADDIFITQLEFLDECGYSEILKQRMWDVMVSEYLDKCILWQSTYTDDTYESLKDK